MMLLIATFILVPPTDITTCGNLILANTIYTLKKDLVTDGTCLVIKAENITVDMNGFNITDSSPTDF